MDLGLQQKVAFVAGSSRGIGLAIARAFMREGASVVITGRTGPALDDAARALAAIAGPDRVRALQGDMTDPADIAAVLDAVLDAFGRIDTVVANVGSGAVARGWDIGPTEWEAALRVNLVGSMMLSAAVLPLFVERRRGSVTFISSIAGVEAIDAPVTYSAAKAAVQAATKSLARLVGPQGVRVNAVAPGNVLFPGGSWERKLAERREEVERYVRTEVPLQRFATPEEIADAVVFLASDRAAFITGAVVVIDGGQTRSFI